MKKERAEDLLYEQLQAGISSGLTLEDLQEFEYVKAMCILNVVVETLIKHKILKEKEMMNDVVNRVKEMYKANVKVEKLLKKAKSRSISYIG